MDDMPSLYWLCLFMGRYVSILLAYHVILFSYILTTTSTCFIYFVCLYVGSQLATLAAGKSILIPSLTGLRWVKYKPTSQILIDFTHLYSILDLDSRFCPRPRPGSLCSFETPANIGWSG